MMIAIVLASTLSMGSVAPAQDAVRAVENPERTAEDIEVMRRLLVKEIGSVIDADTTSNAQGYTVLHFYSSSVGSRTAVTHSRGYHVPGLGAVFSLDLSLPLSEVEVVPEDEEDEPRADDEWEDTRREVLGGRGGSSGPHEYIGSGALGQLKKMRAKNYEIDPDEIDDVVDSVVKTVARHGSRIRGLARGDVITVAMYVTSSGLQPVAIADPGEGDDQVATIWSTVSGSALRAPDVRIVVQVPIGDALAYIDDRIDGRELRERSVVHRY